MADNTGINIPNSTAKLNDDQKMPRQVAEIEFQASKVIERLEEAIEREESGDGPQQGQGAQVWKSSHGFLPLQSKQKEEILQDLEDLIIHEDTSDEEDNVTLTSLPQLDETARLAIISQSLTAYSSSLDRSHLQRLTTRITSETTRWLSHMFRFLDCSAFFHDDILEGLIRITRMLLHYKYPTYLENGFMALTGRLPVIYTSVVSPISLAHHICRQLGLPLMCVHPVPCNTVFGSHQKMDVSALERLIQEDLNGDRVPLIVLADVGTPIVGHVDNVTRLNEICRANDMWLHLRGHSLAALAMATSPSVPTRIADSMTLPIGVWLGVPALPIVTLYRQFESTNQHKGVRESALPLIAGLAMDHFTFKLNCLSLWTSLQSLGREGMQTRLKNAFESSEYLHNKLCKYPCVRLLNQKPGGETGSITVLDLATKPVSSNIMFDVISCTVVFQFVPEGYEGKTDRVPPYFDKLNAWLGQITQRDIPQLPLELCELEPYGVILRYCPLEISTERLPSKEDIDKFIQYFHQQLEILTATVQHKENFIKLVENNDSLRVVDMPQWAGLGGVRYLPIKLKDYPEPYSEELKHELNNLNSRVVDALRSTDGAFSLGEGVDGLICVRFGMVTAETDVEELLHLVESTGKEVEESAKYLESLSEIVRKGIEAATLDLQKENAERVWQEGILRHVPVVGNFVNWWSPLSKESGIKGRSLNLTAGVVESTENIYRYHMQIQGTSPPGSKGPPTPQVQTTIAPPSNFQQHSRSSSQQSHSSQTKQSATPTAVVVENNVANS